MRLLRLYLELEQVANIKQVYSLDEYRFGMNALWWYNRTGEEKYKTAADGIRGMLDRHPRTPSGGVSISFFLLYFFLRASEKADLLNSWPILLFIV